MDILHHTSLLPSYDRTLLQEKIIHIGLGAFHRGHQAFILGNLCYKSVWQQYLLLNHRADGKAR